MGDAIAYESKLPYHTKRMHAAAIYCSDGRVCEQYDDFLMNGLKLPRYDRVALPGGPASLAGYSQARLEEAGVIDELKFLVDAHGLKRVVLIQHEDCAFYTQHLAADAKSLVQLQKADLVRATYAIRHAMSMDTIDGYFARRTEIGVRFEPVELD